MNKFFFLPTSINQLLKIYLLIYFLIWNATRKWPKKKKNKALNSNSPILEWAKNRPKLIALDRVFIYSLETLTLDSCCLPQFGRERVSQQQPTRLLKRSAMGKLSEKEALAFAFVFALIVSFSNLKLIVIISQVRFTDLWLVPVRWEAKLLKLLNRIRRRSHGAAPTSACNTTAASSPQVIILVSLFL